MEYLQQNDGEAEDTAWRRMRGKLGTGKHLDETCVLLPQNVPGSTGVAGGVWCINACARRCGDWSMATDTSG